MHAHLLHMDHSNETFLAKFLQSTIIHLPVIGQTGFTVTDIREGPGPGPSLFLDQTQVRRAKKNFLDTAPPPNQRVWMTGGPPYLKVSIRHC